MVNPIIGGFQRTFLYEEIYFITLLTESIIIYYAEIWTQQAELTENIWTAIIQEYHILHNPENKNALLNHLVICNYTGLDDFGYWFPYFIN